MLRKINVLSIDWDYFIDATVKERILYFPDATTDSSSVFLQSLVWANRYVSTPQLRDFNLINDYDKVCAFLKKSPKAKALMVADSHRHAYDFVMKNVKKTDKVELVNIDFHHDLYGNPNENGEAHAGDWALKLKGKLTNLNLKWVKREDSEMPKTPIDVITMDEALQKKYDYIFLCRSGAWSPPHLDGAFLGMANNLLALGPVMGEDGIMEEREFEGIVEELDSSMKQMMEHMARDRAIEKEKEKSKENK